MKISNITLIYCLDNSQRDGIRRVFRRYRVRELDGMQFLETEEEMGQTIKSIQTAKADVAKDNIRLIYVLDTLESAKAFKQKAEQLRQVYGKGRGLYKGCSVQVIWKTDYVKMSECYEHISESLKSLQEENVMTKLMLVSQQNTTGAILRGIDGETVSTLVVLTACGKLDARSVGVFIYETKQLSILKEDIDNILKSQIIRQLKKLPDAVYTENFQSPEAQQYRKELWKRFFDDWSGEPVNGDRLEHIRIDNKVRSLLPDEADFCVFAPYGYDEIHRALEFFDDENASRLLEKLPEMLVESWQRHAITVLKGSPDLYNKDVQHFFEILGRTVFDENSVSIDSDASISEPNPHFFVRKERFYLGKLIEQARRRLDRYSAKVRSSFLKALPEVCRELARTVISPEIIRRRQLLDALKKGDLSNEPFRYVSGEELERFRGYNTEIVNDICTRVQEKITRQFLHNYNDAGGLIYRQNPDQAKEAWWKLVQASTAEVLRYLTIRNLIQQINSLPPEDITDGHIKTNGKLMAIGFRVEVHQMRNGFCVMSSAINPNKRETIVNACGLPRDAYEVIEGYENVSAVLEYQLSPQIAENEVEPGKMLETVLHQIASWDRDPGVVAPERTGEEKPDTEPSSPSKQADAPKNKLDSIIITDNGNSWTFRSEDWDGHNPSATIRVTIRALAANGTDPKTRYRDFNVGYGGRSQFTISKDDEGFYGICHVTMESNADYMGTRELQGMRIISNYKLTPLRKKVVVSGDAGEKLKRYRVVIMDEEGKDDLPILQNDALAVSYTSRESDEWTAARECVFYVSRGNKKPNVFEIFIPIGREDSFQLIPASRRDLYELIRE